MPFAGARVLSFESRRATEMAELIRINGGDPFVAPALVEVPLANNGEAFSFAEALYSGRFDMLIFLTGVGARLLDRALATRYPEDQFRQALRNITVVARGPKPMAVMREWGVSEVIMVPEPNTWREILSAIKDRPEKSVAVQEYGKHNPELVEGLKAQGRAVTLVPVYQWQFPENTKPLEEALDRLIAGDVDVALFTTSVQVDHLFEMAERRERRAEVLDALRRIYLASIGPTCSEALREYGLKPAMEPSHPKMGLLVREAAADFALGSK
jgi:uroporphyrinogen-III synthase